MMEFSQITPVPIYTLALDELRIVQSLKRDAPLISPSSTLILNNLTDNLVNIHLQGGTLTIEWNKQNNHIYMEGPANIVYEGII